jgi:hypothetical protein
MLTIHHIALAYSMYSINIPLLRQHRFELPCTFALSPFICVLRQLGSHM